MLVLQQLKDMPAHTVFAHGETEDNSDGVNTTGSGRMLHWVAKRGEIHDWAIYIAPASWDDRMIMLNGDKVTDEHNIKKLVPCNDEAYEMYRR